MRVYFRLFDLLLVVAKAAGVLVLCAAVYPLYVGVLALSATPLGAAGWVVWQCLRKPETVPPRPPKWPPPP